MPAPVLDRHAHNTSTGGTTTTISVTTGAPNTLLLVAAVAGTTSTTSFPSLSIAGAGLTWNAIDTTHAAAGLGGSPGHGVTTQLWWAIAAAQLTSQVVTITSTMTVDDCCTIYASFTGAYNAAPVDPNAGATTASFYTGAFATASVVLSSSNADDIGIICEGANSNNTMTASAPVVLIETAYNPGGALYASLGLAYRTFTAPQSNVSIALGGSNSVFGLIGAMFTADASAVALNRQYAVSLIT